jgi:hypothetical protein
VPHKFPLIILTVFVLTPIHLAHAQQPKKVLWIGYLATRSEPGANEKAFLKGLQSLGYIEGQSIAIEWRYAKEKFDRLPDLASELVRLKVDVGKEERHEGKKKKEKRGLVCSRLGIQIAVESKGSRQILDWVLKGKRHEKNGCLYTD